MPYMGSKSQIAEKIINILPEGKILIDLFGGGGAVSHCAALSYKWEKVIYNELDPLIYSAFCKAINGDFENENRWISSADFHKLKGSDPYVALCFSFGTNLKNYIYSAEKEEWKKALHYCKVLRDDSLLRITPRPGSIHRPAELENFDRLRRLRSMGGIKNKIMVSNADYKKVVIPENSVIYCDPPYMNTEQYNISFDHESFFEWALKQKNDVFISEYTMPEGFYLITEFEKLGLMSPNGRTTKKELLFCNHNFELPEQLSLF